MYIEETLAEIIRNAAAGERIRGLRAAEVFTDMVGTNEWEGRAKVYVIRDDTRLIGDLSDSWEGPGCAESDVTIAAIGADKIQALEVITDTTRALRRALMARITGLDELTGSADEIETDPEDEIYLPVYDEGGLDQMTIDAGDTMTIDTGDIASAGTISADGRLEGGGWLIAIETAGNIYRPLLYVKAGDQIGSWKITGASGVERFDNGAFREQYYQTRRFSALHQIEIV